MQTGDLVHVTHFDARFHAPGGIGVTSMGYRAGNGRPRKRGETPVFAMLFLGEDKLEDPQLDPNQVLAALGWAPLEGATVDPPPAVAALLAEVEHFGVGYEDATVRETFAAEVAAETAIGAVLNLLGRRLRAAYGLPPAETTP